jgi:hypothetical protein
MVEAEEQRIKERDAAIESKRQKPKSESKSEK